MSIAALFIIAKKSKQPKTAPTCERINKLWWIHIMEYHSAIKRSKIHATVWINHKSIMLSSRGWTWKFLYCVILYWVIMWCSGKGKTVRWGNSMWLPEPGNGRDWLQRGTRELSEYWKCSIELDYCRAYRNIYIYIHLWKCFKLCTRRDGFYHM